MKGRKWIMPAMMLGVVPHALAGSDERPNIVFVLTDDLGIGDLGVYGQEKFETPHIDAMARNGLTFTQHYAGSTVSAPSRGSLITGKHTGRSYIRGNKNAQNADGRVYDHSLLDSEVTLAEVLRGAGYATACIGKWGLGGPGSEGHPNNQGFDYFFGYLGQLNAHRQRPEFLHENQTLVPLDGKTFAQELFMQKTFEFISHQAESEQPFFLFLTPTIPHADLDVQAEYRAKYLGKYCEEPYVGEWYKSDVAPKAVFAGMIDKLDEDMGRLMKYLEDAGLLENTIVIFTSDNGTHQEGGHDPDFFDSNGPFRGYKRDLYDGGIRTPMIIQWNKAIKPGRVTGHISAFWDFMPTFAELAGVKTPEGTDGISMLPTLLGEGVQKQHEFLYWEFHEQGGKQAVRAGDWKLIRLKAKTPEDSVLELYNLSEDPGERLNVVTQYPALVERLTRLMDGARVPNEVFPF